MLTVYFNNRFSSVWLQVRNICGIILCVYLTICYYSGQLWLRIEREVNDKKFDLRQCEKSFEIFAICWRREIFRADAEVQKLKLFRDGHQTKCAAIGLGGFIISVFFIYWSLIVLVRFYVFDNAFYNLFLLCMMGTGEFINFMPADFNNFFIPRNYIQHHIDQLSARRFRWAELSAPVSHRFSNHALLDDSLHFPSDLQGKLLLSVRFYADRFVRFFILRRFGTQPQWNDSSSVREAFYYWEFVFWEYFAHSCDPRDCSMWVMTQFVLWFDLLFFYSGSTCSLAIFDNLFLSTQERRTSNENDVSKRRKLKRSKMITLKAPLIES